MINLKLLSDFQVRFGDNLAKIIQLLGAYYAEWAHFKQLILSVAEKLGDANTFPGCMDILMKHEFKPKNWNVESFVLFLNYINPQLSKMFLCIINAVINHPNFGPYSVHIRNNCRIHMGYTAVRIDHLEYFGFEFYDSLVQINAYFMKFIPVHCSMPFFLSRLPLCDLDVAEFRESSLRQRQQMLVISGISRLLIRRFFVFTKYQISNQSKMVLARNFSDIIA